jgi:hypothetical protein
VLRPGGRLLAGFNNPATYIFDWQAAEQGDLRARYTLPYSDLESPTESERQMLLETGHPLEWSHTLTDQIAGQLDAGLVITGFYEDTSTEHYIGRYLPLYIATCAVKLEAVLAP